jgi:hypothetical protein
MSDTEFLNVDLDVAGDADDLMTLLDSIKSSVIVLSHLGREASLELAQGGSSLEATVTGLVNLVDALEPSVRAIWDRLELRRANIGIQAASQPHAACYAMSARAVQQLAALRFEVAVTVYAPIAD